MSFILDALRKSDQLRQTNAAPTLTAGQQAVPDKPRPSLFIHAAIGAALLAVGILAGSLQPWSNSAPPSSQSSSQPSPALMPTPEQVPASATASMTIAPPSGSATNLTVSRPPRPQTPATVASSGATPPASESSEPHPAAALPAPVSAAAAPAAPTAPAAETPPLALAELPPAILAEIPKMAVTAHSYSKKPKASFVFVNDRMLHEEELLAPGLKLERITPDGMIFSYKGYRFRRGLQP